MWALVCSQIFWFLTFSAKYGEQSSLKSRKHSPMCVLVMIFEFYLNIRGFIQKIDMVSSILAYSRYRTMCDPTFQNTFTAFQFDHFYPKNPMFSHCIRPRYTFRVDIRCPQIQVGNLKITYMRYFRYFRLLFSTIFNRKRPKPENLRTNQRPHVHVFEHLRLPHVYFSSDIQILPKKSDNLKKK